MSGTGRTFLVAVMLAAGVFAADDIRTVSASIDRIYTLPFYSSSVETCHFGCYLKNGIPHAGTDWQLGATTNPGEVVAAAFRGTVDHGYQQPPESAGYFITIDHQNTHITRYLHLQSYVAADSSMVSRGEVIGLEGNSGGPWCQNYPQCTIKASPYHLHFETRVDVSPTNPSGTPVDPYGTYTPGTYLWEDSPASTADFAPAVATNATSGGGRVDNFIRTSSNLMYQRTYNGSTWSGWSEPRPNDCLKSAPGATTTPSLTRIFVFYRGCNDVIYWTKWTGGA